MAKRKVSPEVKEARAKTRAAKRAKERAEKKAREYTLTEAMTPQQKQAARLAQIVNLHIAGFTLADIGAAIGASADEVDRLLASETQRYVRNQPSLRVYVRNFVSEKYLGLLDAVYDDATNRKHPDKLENSAQALRILKEMARLHGAEAPTQTEVKVETAPEAVEKLVSALSAAQGLGYDDNVFDAVEVVEVVDAEVLHEASEQAHLALEQAHEAVTADQTGGAL